MLEGALRGRHRKPDLTSPKILMTTTFTFHILYKGSHDHGTKSKHNAVASPVAPQALNTKSRATPNSALSTLYTELF